MIRLYRGYSTPKPMLIIFQPTYNNCPLIYNQKNVGNIKWSCYYLLWYEDYCWDKILKPVARRATIFIYT